jgi:MFS family permease
LPYGFQLIALPVFLLEAGVSLAGIGMATALSLPWSLKFVWGPWIDRYGSPRFGRRRSWILPLQAGLLLCVLGTAFVPPSRGVMGLLGMVFLMNLFASTMDVAVDGLAVDLLQRSELGYGNIAQVVGYKVGILTGGGFLLLASEWVGWQRLFLAMTALVALALVLTMAFREGPGTAGIAELEASPTLREILARLKRAFLVPGAGWVLLFVATYKLGESMADTMFKPFLLEAGFSRGDIGWWVGSWGVALSIVGSILGGIAASRWGILRTLAMASVLRALAVGGEWWLSVVEPTTVRMVAVVSAEQMFGGAVTVALFAFMMSKVDRRIGATHYTLLATVEVSGKLLAYQISGFLAEAVGFTTLFGVSTVLSVAFLGLLIPVWRNEPGPEAPGTTAGATAARG